MSLWTVKVTDHSYWNDIRNWGALRDLGVSAVILRASSGGSYHDPKFKPYHDGAKSAGLKVLAYHVSHPLFTAEANVVNYQKAISGIHLDGPPVLDCQLTGGQSTLVIRTRVKEMFYRLKSIHGMVINYTAKWWWDLHMGTTGWVKEFPPFLANYFNSLDGTNWPSPNAYAAAIPNDYIGEERFLWQFSERGLFPQVSPGNMDKGVGYPRFEKMVFTSLPTALPEQPVFPTLPKVKILVNGLRIREAPVTGKEIGFLYTTDSEVPVIREVLSGTNVWLEIGYKQYCARIHNGVTYATYV